MDRTLAIDLRHRALESITTLSALLTSAIHSCEPDEVERIKAGVGIAIGEIQSNVLDLICRQYPDLDDLR